MTDKVFTVTTTLNRNRVVVAGDYSELYPGEEVRVKDGIVIKTGVVETRVTGGAVVSLGTR